ncbi:MAG: DUF1501 domain-containing protein [Anaerolineae bacterium]|nr:DUF1501 domain-containing protein [Anaerolineae bacterium]
MNKILTRKEFLQAAAAVPYAIRWPAWIPRLSFAPEKTDPKGDVLVVIFLRGAADALNMVVPHGEQAYYRARPTLAIPRPDDSRAALNQRALDLDGFFGFHPGMASLLPSWQEGQLAIIHACGAPDESRSHFKAMELMERGLSDEHGPASGWIGRHLAVHHTNNPSPLRAIGLGSMVPLSLQGPVPATAMQSIVDFHLGGDERAARQFQSAMHSLYLPSDELGIIGRETLNILDTLEKLDPSDYQPANQATYPQSEFGVGLRQIAMLVKAQVGLEVATLDLGGWDTHFAQGSTSGLMTGLIQNLSEGLSAFHADLHDHMGSLTVVVMSEFGRRVQENASLGTDHGHGGLMMLMGGNVSGGQILGAWPGVGDGQLFGPGDLAVTTDYRDVLGEVLKKRLGNPNLDSIFPDFRVRTHGFLQEN